MNELIEVPFEELEPETLLAVIEAFILQEGTNYGVPEFSLEAKVAQVRRQLEHKQVHLVFNAESESCHLITERDLRNHNAGHA